MILVVFRNSSLSNVIHYSTLLNTGRKSILFSVISFSRGLPAVVDPRLLCTGSLSRRSQVRYGSKLISKFHTSVSHYESETPTPNILQTGAQVPSKAKTISKAMKAYLERARQYEENMKAATAEFEIGRRHLANMMGMDADTMTQDDIDRAIKYLFPSFLYEKKARPMMKHPEEINPKRKAAEFDETGRPFHFLFYTKTPNYYKILYDAVEKMEELNAFEDKMLARGIKNVPTESVLNLQGSEWVSKGEFELKVLETLKDEEYEYFTQTMTRLVEHNYSFRAQDFIMKYRKPLVQVSSLQKICPPDHTEDGRQFVRAKGFRKTAEASVVVWNNGSGNVEINGNDITYFSSMQDREQILFPLQFTDLLGHVDIEATVSGGGHSGQAGAIRHAVSVAIKSFLSPEIVEKMRIAGLLTRDRRKRERKKPGQEGARKKFTWKKR